MIIFLLIIRLKKCQDLMNFRLGGRDDDAVSVAGTVFEEPWDSSAWENLLDLANHGDDTHGISQFAR